MANTCDCCDRRVCAAPFASEDAARVARTERRKAREAEARAAYRAEVERAAEVERIAAEVVAAGGHLADGSCCPAERDAECACSSAPTECETCARFFALHPNCF